MKIQLKNKKNILFKRALFVFIGSILLFSVIISLYALKNNLFIWKIDTKDANATVNYNKPSSEQTVTGNNIKRNSLDQQSSTSTSSNPDQKQQIDITISAINEDKNARILYIRSLIGTTENTGVCTLTLSKPSFSPITITVNTQALPDASTCKGFDIPLSELPSGTYQLTLSYSSNTSVGSVTKSIIIN